MDKASILEKVKIAEEISVSVDPSLKEVAFRTILDNLLKLGNGKTSLPNVNTSGAASLSQKNIIQFPKREELKNWLDSVASVEVPTSYSPILKGKNLGYKALVVLDVLKTLGVQDLTPSEIERILTKRFGQTGIYATNISNSLRSLIDDRLVIRKSIDQKTYAYEITTDGSDFLQKISQNNMEN